QRHRVVALDVAAERADVERDAGRRDGECDVAGVRVEIVAARAVDGAAESRVPAHRFRVHERRVCAAEHDGAASGLGVDVAGDVGGVDIAAHAVDAQAMPNVTGGERTGHGFERRATGCVSHGHVAAHRARFDVAAAVGGDVGGHAVADEAGAGGNGDVVFGVPHVVMDRADRQADAAVVRIELQASVFARGFDADLVAVPAGDFDVAGNQRELHDAAA